MSTNNCGGCLSALEGEDSIQCLNCFKYYDLICANIPKKSLKNVQVRAKWKCPECLLKKPKSDNTNTPVRHCRPESPPIPNQSFISPIVVSLGLSDKRRVTNLNCAACRSIIVDGEEYLSCTLDKCKLKYHLQCSGEVIVTEGHPISWVCAECTCSPKGDNSVITLTQESDPNVTLRKKAPMIQDALNQVEFQELSFEMSKLRLEMESLKEQFGKAVCVISNYECKLTEFASQIVLLNTQLKQCTTMLPAHQNVINQQQPLYITTQQQLDMVTTLQESEPITQAGAATPAQTPHRAKKHKKVKAKSTVNKAPGDTSPKQPNAIQVNPTDHKVSTIQTLELLRANNQTSPAKDSTSSVDDHASPCVDHVALDNDIVTTDGGVFLAVNHDDDQNWTKVTGKKFKKPMSLCGVAGPNITNLKAVEPRKYLHLWNMESSADEIRDYLRTLCPTGACTVEELRARGNYKSYKIGIPIIYFEKCYSVDVWPMNARVNTWIARNGNHKAPDSARLSEQTFRA
ncbi:hypothetical protein PYW07_009483 [Mythimna separata]|uniref:Zinc finger PHD-type domain-containing protein n=1 Tax=Mythimna separata TaxID=271217 RepID=A0AAD7YBM2_MYTSE|nr:hypothetical protein PYW07_009483 [Mythimna separata]